ncbi:GNAT family N-acetyltransferase [Salinicoccus albus]|uniref:GNAT family N-acetyltransferase n=1 Tax=Salinicoccus albus TaxID=418756 RepID=UPI0003723F0A|nr:GNAT family N-acetyltransferase [Salinicoccus albus]
MEIIEAESKQQYQQCLEVRKRVFVEEQNVPISREIDEHEDIATHLLLLDSETPIGTVRYRPLNKELIKVERMAVLPEYRGRSLGQDLMTRVHDHAKLFGFTHSRLGAQVHAVAFYERLGYRVASEEFEDAGIPHVYMERTI